jgi:glycosyltransferase involved in cell wall biosynthesis
VTRPDVTVVIPTKDRPDMLVLALASVCAQRDVAVEILVVDDGTEVDAASTVELVGDRRIRAIRNGGPHGVSGARNTGIDAARGRWVAFLDDDDAWAPTKLAAQLRTAIDTGAMWAYAGYVTTDEDLRVCGGSPPDDPGHVMRALRRHNAVPAGASGVIVRREALEAVGPFDPSLVTSEDWDMWIRLARVSAPVGVAQPLVALRAHRRMASRDVDRLLHDIGVVATRYDLPVDRARHERWAAWMRLEDGDVIAALGHYARAARRGDVTSIARAVVAVTKPDVARRPCVPGASPWAREAQRWCDDVLRRAALPPSPPRIASS